MGVDVDGAPGVAGAEMGAPGRESSGDTADPDFWASSVSVMLVTKNAAASPAVARVNILAVPRPVMKPPDAEPPMPRAPPSERWSNTTPTKAAAIIR